MKQIGLPPPMISYAQHGEDVLLRRVFANKRHGFYVDVGAGYPTVDSLTKHFYDLGWQGINVEPQPDLYAYLTRARPRDSNLKCVIGTMIGHVPLTIFRGSWGLATSNRKVIQRHRKAKYSSASIIVPSQTLDQILTEHRVTSLDFMKIDVEGQEGDVLRSCSLRRWKPRVLIVESVIPTSTIPSYRSWEKILLSARYRCALFDGLNRYYAQKTDRFALQKLSLPTNPSDQYIPYRWWQLITPKMRRRYIQRKVKDGKNMEAFERFEKESKHLLREFRQAYL